MTEPKNSFNYTPSRLYEITINPSDYYQFPSAGDLRDNKVVNHVRGLLKTMNIVYSLRMEVAFPQHGTASFIPRIHFHGFIYWKSYEQLYNFFVNDFLKLTQCSSVQINYSRTEYWLSYILKNSRFIPPVLHRVESIPLHAIVQIPAAKARDNDNHSSIKLEK